MAFTKPSAVDISDVSSVNYSSMAQSESNASDFFKVDSMTTDGAQTDGTTYTPNFQKWHGYYRVIPEFKCVIDRTTDFTIGKDGFITDKNTENKVKNIKGWGKDDFNTILKNMLRSCQIAGDSFAEIIRDKAGRIINLKPLNPGTIKIVVNKSGIITGYKQMTSQNKEIPFKPDEIFHLSWQRIADEIHGIPLGEALEDLIKMRNESMQDQKVFFHRYVKPITIIPIDTDDDAEITSIKNTYKEAYQKGEVMFVGKDTFDSDKIKNLIGDVPGLDPLPWLRYLIRQFVTGSGVPEVIMGWGGDITEASSKIVYLAWQSTIWSIQLWLEEQIKMQLNLKMRFEFSAPIDPEEGSGTSSVKEKSISSDEKKDVSLKKEEVNPQTNSK